MQTRLYTPRLKREILDKRYIAANIKINKL